MRQFHITVNGTSYQVSVEEVSSASAPVPASVPSPVPAAPPAAPTPAAVPAPVATAGGEKVCAPMPGTILDIKTAVGSTVKKGEVLLILEAMKMENEILSPMDATVQQMLVAKGASVNSGDVLLVLG